MHFCGNYQIPCWLSVFKGQQLLKSMSAGWDQMSDVAIEEFSVSLPWETLGLIFSALSVIIHFHCEVLSYQFSCIWLNLSSEYSSVHFSYFYQPSHHQQTLVTRCHNIASIHVWQIIWYVLDHELLLSFIVSLPIIPEQVNLIFICARVFFLGLFKIIFS